MRGFVASLAAPRESGAPDTARAGRSERNCQFQTLFAFELKLLEELGLKPDLAESRLSPGAKQILGKLAALDWAALSRLRASEAQSRELGQFLHDFLTYHLGNLPPRPRLF
jgi:recombinational DNA repair protein (RecF pathway)